MVIIIFLYILKIFIVAVTVIVWGYMSVGRENRLASLGSVEALSSVGLSSDILVFNTQ